MSQKPWYSKGLRFSCTACGRCCTSHGDYQYVYLAEEDVRRISEHLGLERRAFLSQHAARDSGYTILRIQGEACSFLDENGRCAIYPVRPKQCESWPFWEENLERKKWEGPVTEICPGIGSGELTPAEEVERIARETEEWYEDE